MAALQTIRNKAGFFVSAIIALALVSFIIDPKILEAFTKGDRDNIGELLGEKITYAEFTREVDALTQQYEARSGQRIPSNMYGIVREQAWNSIIQSRVYDNLFTQVGLEVEGEELSDMLYGNNIAPIVRQQFTNPETGVFDKDIVVENVKALLQDPARKSQWLVFEDNLKSQRLHSKFMNVLSKSNYTTNADAENGLAKNEKQVDFDFVKIPFATASDVEVSDADIAKLYAEKKSQMVRDAETRNISYVEFDIVPSEKDEQRVKDEVATIYQELQTAKDPMYFAKLNSDERKYDGYIRKSNLNDNLKSLFAAKLGTTLSPEKTGEFYTMAKLVDRKVLADSVELKAILVTAGIENADVAKKADSLVNLFKARKKTFDQLIAENSQDPRQSEIGWQNIKSFSKDLAEKFELAKKKSVFTFKVQAGTVIYYVANKSKAVKQVKIAQIVKYVDPSQETVKNIFKQASEFVANYSDINKYLAEPTKAKRSAVGLEKMSLTVNNLQDSRSLVRAAFDAEKAGMLTDHTGGAIFDFEDKYVVAYLTSASPAGEPSLASVKEEMRIEAMADKKFASLAKNLKKEANITAYAAETKQDVKEANAVRFSNYYIPGIGAEPTVIAKTFKLEKDQVSAPIKGVDALYLVQVKNVYEASITKEKIALYKNSMKQARLSELEVYNSLKEKANLVDNRYTFY